MKDIICVDLTVLSQDQLKSFSAEHNVSYEALLDFKQKTYAKLWITKGGICIAFTLVKDNEFKIKDFKTVRMFNGFIAELNLMDPYAPVEAAAIDMDVDAILDKISKHGIASITLEEKKFLDAQ